MTGELAAERPIVIVVPPLEEADARDPAECEDRLALLGGAFEHVSSSVRADGSVEHAWRRLCRLPPLIRGRVQRCRRCKKVVFHLIPIDFCSRECAEGSSG